MYLSQLTLNPLSRQVQKELANRYELHRTVMQLFKSEQYNQERVLYRVETNESEMGVKVLVQSRFRPDREALRDGKGQPYLLDHEAGWRMKEFTPLLRVGDRLVFRLLANPTARKKVEEGKGGKRLGLFGEEQQMAWLVRKAEEGGFRVMDGMPVEKGFVRGMALKDGQRLPLTLLAVQFDGLLEVTQPEQMMKTLECGIGSGKGFGFGLLSLARMGG